MSTLVCLGLGYCAEHAVPALGARFTRIVGTTRTPERAAMLAARDIGGRHVEMLRFDGETASPDVVAAVAQADAVLISAAPAEQGDPVLAVLGEALIAAPRLRTVVLLSTVGVYGNHGGGWVDEATTPDPTHDRAQARVVAEQAWQAFGQQRGVPVAILRLSGIYGPGQNALVNVRLGRARNIAKPGQVFNRIHVADIAQAIDAAFARAADGVFNITDDEPTPPADPIVFAAALLGVPPPAEIAFAEAVKTMTPMAASFYAENRRVRNDRLKTVLGVTLRYPTYREGLTALHASLKQNI
jgi:nucleoside-diphosphate-sugar epimerase